MLTYNELLAILERHETTTFPRGVGSIARAIEPRSYYDVINDILNENK